MIDTKIKPALTAEEWARSELLVHPEDNPKHRHQYAALALRGQPFGFTREMIEAIRTLVYFQGGGSFCPKCVAQSWEGGTGVVGDPDCVVECGECGWRPRTDGALRQDASECADRIEALLPPEDDQK